jgi:hypothetical protein
MRYTVVLNHLKPPYEKKNLVIDLANRKMVIFWVKMNYPDYGLVSIKRGG